MRVSLSRITKTARAEQPKMGRAREELASGLRSFPVRRYVVFYCPLVDGIEVVDFA